MAAETRTNLNSDSRRPRQRLLPRSTSENVSFVYGKTKFKPVRGCWGGVPIRKLMARLMETRVCVHVDEFYTTARCFLCKNTKAYILCNSRFKKREEYKNMCFSFCPTGSHTMKNNLGDNLVAFRSIRGGSHCVTCGVTSPRDWNGAANITYLLVMRVLNGTVRPTYLTRPPKSLESYSIRRQTRSSSIRTLGRLVPPFRRV